MLRHLGLGCVLGAANGQAHSFAVSADVHGLGVNQAWKGNGVRTMHDAHQQSSCTPRVPTVLASVS